MCDSWGWCSVGGRFGNQELGEDVFMETSMELLMVPAGLILSVTELPGKRVPDLG